MLPTSNTQLQEELGGGNHFAGNSSFTWYLDFRVICPIVSVVRVGVHSCAEREKGGRGKKAGWETTLQIPKSEKRRRRRRCPGVWSSNSPADPWGSRDFTAAMEGTVLGRHHSAHTFCSSPGSHGQKEAAACAEAWRNLPCAGEDSWQELWPLERSLCRSSLWRTPGSEKDTRWSRGKAWGRRSGREAFYISI